MARPPPEESPTIAILLERPWIGESDTPTILRRRRELVPGASR
jgi:hypothetical protein